MNTITLQNAQTSLADLVHGLAPGKEVTITENDRPVARLVPVSAAELPPTTLISPNWPGYPYAGSCEGLFVVPDDFKEPLEEIRECME